MKIFKLISAFLLTAVLLTSCYEDYISDYDYTATYFASQKPLRTVVADGAMDFEVGVTLSGMREDDDSYWVNYVVDTTLLTSISEASGLTLLPSEYYTLGNESEFDIIKDHMRVVKMTMTDAFTADPLSLTNTYALPLRITSASVDSISDGTVDTAIITSRNITILVVKYISPYSGYYYSKGVQYTLGTDGEPTDTLLYSQDDLIYNDVLEFSTLAVNNVATSRIGGNLVGSLEYTMNADGTVSVSSSAVTIDSGSVTYSAEDNIYTLDIIVDKDGLKYHIVEEQILRQDPELDLRFEEW